MERNVTRPLLQSVIERRREGVRERALGCFMTRQLILSVVVPLTQSRVSNKRSSHPSIYLVLMHFALLNDRGIDVHFCCCRFASRTSDRRLEASEIDLCKSTADPRDDASGARIKDEIRDKRREVGCRVRSQISSRQQP